MLCPDVVIIEDDRDIRETIEEILTFEGYVVHGYSNGKEALQGLKTCTEPCIILLDLMMPVMNGQEFLAARRTEGDRLIAIPVVVVSAFADKLKNDESVIGFIRKPVDIEVLLRIVSQHCVKNCKKAS